VVTAAPPRAPAAAGSVGAAVAVSSDEQQQQQQQQQQQDRPSAAAQQAPQGASPPDNASTPVGWSGLLEISRSGGCPGLVGSAVSSWEVELGSQGHVEVACTAHASTGVRRLVKAVIRGLKVRACACVRVRARVRVGGRVRGREQVAASCVVNAHVLLHSSAGLRSAPNRQHL
jgi:hypothetical protein